MLSGHEAKFAKRLSVSDKTTRDRAVKKLKTWLHARSSPQEDDFAVVDMKKLWRGLYFCMWMSDKPLVQEECAESISCLVHCVQTDTLSVRFMRCGWETMCEMWHSIDRLRMDKFLMFIRRFLRHNLQHVRQSNWSSSLLQELVDMLSEVPLHPPTASNTPVGIQLHLIDIVVSVLSSLAAEEEVPQAVLSTVLTPFLELMAKTSNSVLVEACKNDVFGELLECSSIYESVDKAEDLTVSALKVDHAAIAQRLFDMAASKDIRDGSRTTLYLLKRRFDAKAASHHPCSPDSTTSGSNDARGLASPMEQDEVPCEVPSGKQKRKGSATSGDRKRRKKTKAKGKKPEVMSLSSEPLEPSLKGRFLAEVERDTDSMEVDEKPLSGDILLPDVSPADVSPADVSPADVSPARFSPVLSPKPASQVKSDVPQCTGKKRIKISLEDTRVKFFRKRDPVAATPWLPSAKGGKSLLKNRSPTPVRRRFRHLVRTASSETAGDMSAVPKSSLKKKKKRRSTSEVSA